ncbi:centriolin [Plakobranchus ocellatus]|uniref:Centriolin n=1 Tax=Plakobranchus ocellatus TaxID=259542 RepID=A0AAV4ARW7_9GAST|nr:centriolin [Plakobranchus ocellatus]
MAHYWGTKLSFAKVMKTFDVPPNQAAGGRGSRRSSRSRAPRPSIPSAFEPVHRPEPHHPYQAPPPAAATVPVAVPINYSAPVAPVAGPVQPVGSYPLPAHVGPNRTTQTSGVQGPTRGVQVGGEAQGFYPDMTAVFPGGLAPPTAPLDMGAGYGMGGAVPGPTFFAPTGAAGQPAVAFDPVPQEISFNTGPGLQGYPGHPGAQYSVGSHTYIPSGPAQLSHYGPGRVFVPAGAGHRGQHPARVYYPAQRSFPMPAPGGTPMVPMAAGTPVKGGGGGGGVPPTGYFDSSLINAPPSPIRE